MSLGVIPYIKADVTDSEIKFTEFTGIQTMC
jgi:hypothetical protein